MMYFKDRSQPKLYRLILVRNSLPPFSVYAESFVPSFCLTNPIHSQKKTNIPGRGKASAKTLRWECAQSAQNSKEASEARMK